MRIREYFLKHETLLKEFDKKVRSGKNEYEAAREVILSQHQVLHKRMNEIRGKLQVKEVKYES
jgi:hypothetical protein